MKVPVEALREHFSYDPATGVIAWKKKRHGRGCKVGQEAGTVSVARGGCAYRVITIFQKKLYAHRVAWVLAGNEIPEGLCIDHIDGDGLNNRLDNLRLVTLSANQRNSKEPKNNSTGHMNIHHHKGGLKVQVAGKHIGFFQCLKEAIKARDEAHKEMGFHPNHGRKAA